MSFRDRRASHIGVLRPTQETSEDFQTSLRKRRQSIAIGLPARDSENLNEVHDEQSTTPETSQRNHPHSRTKLGAASSYYFAGLPKTPIQKAASARKKLATSMRQTDQSMDASFDLGGKGTDYDGSLSFAEKSYISSSSSSAGEDLLNQSVLSDTTELTASNYVLSAAARQRWSIGGFRRQSAGKKTQQSEETSADEPQIPKRPPINSKDEKSGRRMTLPPATSTQSNQVTSNQNPFQRRDSWQGATSPGAGQTRENAVSFLGALRERRLSRLSSGSHVSTGSNFSGRNDNDMNPPDRKETDLDLELSPRDAVERPKKVPSSPISDDESIVSVGSLFDGLSGGDTNDQTATGDSASVLRPSIINELFDSKTSNTTTSPDGGSSGFSGSSGAKVSTMEDELSAASSTASSSRMEPKSAATDEAIGLVDQESQLGTPMESRALQSTSPRPLPEMVEFTTGGASDVTSELLRAAAMSPFCTTRPRKPSSITPRKLTSSAQRLSLYSEEKKRKLDRSIELADEDTNEWKKPRNSSTTSISLNSSFRKASSRHHGSARKVAFGSPEVVEFNSTSPSMKLTPMPKSLHRTRFELPDDTVEIEADMNALFGNMDNPEAVARLAADDSNSTAGGTPFAIRQKNDDDFEDATRELEINLEQVLDQADDEMVKSGTAGADNEDSKSDMSDDSQGGNLVGEQTEALEISMNELLSKAVMSITQNGQQTIPAVLEPPEEENTVELEVDMGALLLAAESPDQSDDIVMTDDETPVAGHRRSSIASRRFSVEPKRRLSLDEPTAEVESQQQPKESDEPDSQTQQEEILDLDAQEILKLAASFSSWEPDLQDIFSSTINFLHENASIPLADALNYVLREVCEYVVEAHTPEIEPDYIAKLPEADRVKLLRLQTCLRSDKKDDTEKKLGQLMESSGRHERFLLEDWLLGTAVQMRDYLVSQSDDIRNERERVAEEIRRVDDAECALTSTRARVVQKARRKSLDRRRSVAMNLEEEIQELERELEEATAKLEAEHAKKMKLERDLGVYQEHTHLIDTESSTKANALCMSRKWEIFKGLAQWQPQTLTSECITLSRIGPCPGASVCVKFRVSNGRVTSCIAVIDPSVFPKNRSRNSEKLKKVMNYLRFRTQGVCDKLNARKLGKVSEIGKFLRQASWELTRIEMTANEICRLLRRYDAILSVPGLTPDYCGSQPQIIVRFGDSEKTKNTRVEAIFEVPELYPFNTMDMQLHVVEGKVDLDYVQDNISRTAKCGYGYLARTCDVIAASV